MFSRTNLIAIGFSVFLHTLVIVLMSFSWSTSEAQKTVQRPNFVKAELVELKQKSTKATQTKKSANKIDMRRQQQRLEDEARRKKDEQARAARIKKEADEKKRKEEAAEKRRLEENARKEREAEEQRMLTQRQFEQALKAEEGLLLEESYATEASSWQAVLAQRIERNWSRPQSARNGMRCEISLNLVPNGHVVNAIIIKGSGDAAFDRSALAAVEKAQPFPEVKDIPPEVFERYFRKFTLLFSPMDRRL